MKKSIALYKILAVLLIGCAGPVAGAIAPIEDPPEPARQPTETRSAPQAAQVEARPTARPSSTPTVTLLACQFSGELLLEVYQAAGSLIAVDACTGAALADRDPISLRHVTISAVTPDGSRLVLVKARNSSGTNAELSLLDLATWQETATGTIFETWPRVVVSPDSRTAAFVYFSSVCCQATLETYDLAGQRPLAKHTFEPNQNPLHLWFDADGGSLIVYVEDDLTGETTQPSQIVRLDATTLRPLQDLTLDGVLDGWVEDASVAVPTTEPPMPAQLNYAPGVAFDAAREMVYVVHADSNRLTRVDLGTMEMETLDIAPELSWLDRLMGWMGPQTAHAKVMNGTTRTAILSPDGARLYALGVTNLTVQDENGNWELLREFTGLQVIDPATGAELAVHATETDQMRLTSDGRYLLLWGWSSKNPYFPWTEIFDLAKGEFVATIESYQVVDSIMVDGRRVLVGVRSNQPTSRFLILDGETFAPMARWEIDGYATLISIPWTE